MPRAIGYFREEQPRRAEQPSLTEQNRAFLEFCKRGDLDVGATFLDSDSGEQAGLRQMLEYLRHNSVDACVVIDSLQRLGRDTRQIARAYFQIEGLGVRLLTLDGAACQTETIIARWQQRDAAERTAERVRSAMRSKAIRGEALGRPPYGYRVGSRRRLEPVPEEASIVRYIFRLYNQDGLGIRLIARRLNEEGYRTRRAANWSMVTIRDLLRNRAYLGTYARFGIRVPGSHPALISAEDYRRAQERMNRRRTSGGKRSPSPFLLSGLVRCGYCGNRMIGVSRRQSWQRQGDGSAAQAEYRYYQCETRTNQSMCDYHTRRASDLEAEVRRALLAELRRAQPRGEQNVDPDEKRRLQGRLRLLDRRLERLLDAGATGQFPASEVRATGIELARQQLALEQAIEAADCRTRRTGNSPTVRDAEPETLPLLQDTAWAALDIAEQQALLRGLLLTVSVRDDAIQVVLRA